MAGEQIAVPPVPAVDPAKPAVGAEPTRDYKVNGKIVKLTQSQADAYTQKGFAADQKLKSMDVLQGKTAGLIQALKTPEGLLSILKDPALGANPKEVFKKLMASDIVDDELKEAMSKWVYDNVVVQGKKSPEQIEQEKKLARLEQFEKDEAKRKEDALSAQQKQQVDGIYQAVRTEVTKQIVADKFFPKNEGAIRMVIEKLRVMNKKGAQISTESVGKALDLVKKDYLLLQQSILDSDDDAEALISRIGEARALKISKALIARLKKKSAPAADAKTDDEKAPENLDSRNIRKYGRERHGYQVLDVM